MKWLKDLRGKIKRTPGALARLSAITQASYQNIENNPIGPREKLLVALWRESGIDAGDILLSIEREILEAEERKAKEALESIRARKRVK